MDVKADGVPVAHPAAAHVGLVRQDEGCRHGVHRDAGALVVVADGGDDGGGLLGACAHLVENPERHDRAGLRMVDAVHHIADIVHKACNAGQFHLTLAVAKISQQLAGNLCGALYMGKAVLGKAHGRKAGIGLLNIGADLG